MAADSENEAVYVISVASQLTRLHPQTLRLYERLGLIHPQRVSNNRIFSRADIDRLLQIRRLTQEMGVNLAGVEIILDLLEKIEKMQQELDHVKTELAIERNEIQLLESPAGE